MATNIELKDHYYRFQSGNEIPADGDLTNVVLQLCHKLSIVETLTGKVIGETQGEGILSIGTVSELDVKYPGFAEKNGIY